MGKDSVVILGAAYFVFVFVRRLAWGHSSRLDFVRWGARGGMLIQALRLLPAVLVALAGAVWSQQPAVWWTILGFLSVGVLVPLGISVSPLANRIWRGGSEGEDLQRVAMTTQLRRSRLKSLFAAAGLVLWVWSWGVV